MPNNQLHTLTAISNSIDSADLFVVVDRSELTTNTVSLGELSDAIDGTIFLSSSYASRSSFVTGTTPSCSLALNTPTSSHATFASGSGVIANSSSYAISSSYCHTHRDLFEITSSSDTLNLLTSNRGNGSIVINPHSSSFGAAYVLRPINYTDIIGSRIIRPSSGSNYTGLPSGSYEFEVSKLDSPDRPLRFGAAVSYTTSSVTRYSEFVYFSPGGAQNASGPGIAAISASFASISSSVSNYSLNSTFTSQSLVASSCSGSSVSISSSFSHRSKMSERCKLSYTSSNGPLPGMILLYAGVFLSGSNRWYNCDGRTYTSSLEPGLSASIGQKFSTGSVWPSGPVVINRLPNITTNLPTSSGGSPPYNSSLNDNLYQITSSGPSNSDISRSYAVVEYLTGSYADGTIVYGSSMGPSGSAFYYNIKR